MNKSKGRTKMFDKSKTTSSLQNSMINGLKKDQDFKL
jgi:hypothetical protein